MTCVLVVIFALSGDSMVVERPIACSRCLEAGIQMQEAIALTPRARVLRIDCQRQEDRRG